MQLFKNLKLTYFSFWLLLISSVSLPFACRAVVDPLSNPELYDHRQIEVRGFLYRSESGSLILSSQPCLKSCCVGIQPQIVIKSLQEITPSDKAITLTGIFKIDSIRQYVLDDARELPEQKIPLLLITLLIGFLMAWLLYIRQT